MTEKSVGGRNKNNGRAHTQERKLVWAVRENMIVEFYSRNLFSENVFLVCLLYTKETE